MIVWQTNPDTRVVLFDNTDLLRLDASGFPKGTSIADVIGFRAAAEVDAGSDWSWKVLVDSNGTIVILSQSKTGAN